MTPHDLLASLHAAGVEVVQAHDNLRLRGPEGALTPDLLAAVKQHKPALLRLLVDREAHPGSATAPAPDRPACGHADAIVVMYVDGYGTLCGACWTRWVRGGMDWPGQPGGES